MAASAASRLLLLILVAGLAGCDSFNDPALTSAADHGQQAGDSEQASPSEASPETGSAESDADATSQGGTQPPDSEQSQQTTTSDQQSGAANRDGAGDADRSKPDVANPRSRSVGNDAVVDISFDDLNCNLQVDVVFRPFMLTERARELDGRRVRVAGVMLPHTQTRGIAEFVLLRNAECKFGPGGQADHLIQVKLKDGVTTDYRGDRPLEVVGRLKINPFNGPGGITYCIYDLENSESVTWKRR